MKRLFLSALLFSCLIYVSAQNKTGAAQTPPMGWNSYNCFGSAVHEDEVKANTDYMAQKLKPFGWQYIVVDFLWSYPNRSGSHIGNIPQNRLYDGSYIPWLAMDKWGRLLPDDGKFPSAFGGKGFKPLADYIHAAGLKFGIHVMRGIPRQAVWAKAPVLGANGITADMIADTSSVCTWSNHMYGLDMAKKGAQEYLNSLLKLYAEWEIDFVKVDDLSRPYPGGKWFSAFHRGATPLSQAAHVAQNGNMWRLADDFWDNWKEVLQMFQLAKDWEGKGGPGHWPDCDMLQIGKLSKRGPVGPERYSRFTDDELCTHFTFWAICRSPLMIGGDMPENRPIEEKLFTNKEVIAVNQQGQNPVQVSKTEKQLIWMSHAAAGKDVYVAAFNLTGDTQSLKINFPALGLKGKVNVRDLWKQKDAGVYKNSYQQDAAAHGTVLLKLTALK